MSGIGYEKCRLFYSELHFALSKCIIRTLYFVHLVNGVIWGGGKGSKIPQVLWSQQIVRKFSLPKAQYLANTLQPLKYLANSVQVPH